MSLKSEIFFIGLKSIWGSSQRFCSALPKGVTYRELKNLLNSKNIMLIDVRDTWEILEHGKIPGSINIPCKCCVFSTDPFICLMTACIPNLIKHVTTFFQWTRWGKLFRWTPGISKRSTTKWSHPNPTVWCFLVLLEWEARRLWTQQYHWALTGVWMKEKLDWALDCNITQTSGMLGLLPSGSIIA